MNTLLTKKTVLAIGLFFAAMAVVRAGEIATATSGAGTNQSSIKFEVTDEPVTYYDAWDAMWGFEAKTYNLDQSHIGYRDLTHGMIPQAYRIPRPDTPWRYFKRQTIASQWSEDPGTDPASINSRSTTNGTLNAQIDVNDLGAIKITSVTASSGTTTVYRHVTPIQDMYGTITGYNYSPYYTSTDTWNATGGFRYQGGTLHWNQTETFSTTEDGTHYTIQYLGGAAPFYDPRWAWPIYWDAGTNSEPYPPAPTSPFGGLPVFNETSAQWNNSAPNGTGGTYKLDASLVLSNEDTLADVQSRIDRDRALVGFDLMPWGSSWRVRNAQVSKSSAYDDDIWLYNYTRDFLAFGSFHEEKAQLRFNTPPELRIPGMAFRGRVIETFHPDDGSEPQVVQIHEVAMYDKHWESDVIVPVMHSGDGYTALQDFSAVTEAIQPRKILVFPPPGGVPPLTAPVEYSKTKPNVGWEPQVTDASGSGNIYRQVLKDSKTLQQINLGDAWGALWNWDTATAKYAILPGATTEVRLWHWTDDGSTLGVWNLLAPGDDLRVYYGSDRDLIFAEALTAGQATLRFTIELNGQQVHDDIVIEAAPVKLSLAVDANRDGIVELPPDDPNATYNDATSSLKPYRFWLNDDDDVDDDDPDDSENAPVSTPDFTDNKIDGVRDLEDFARLKIYLGGLQDAVRQGQIRVGLKWKGAPGSSGGPGIKLWRNLSPNGGTEYLTDINVARQHLALRDPGTIQGALSYIIPTQYWTDVGLSESQPYGNLLFEGISAGKDQLVITLHNADGTEISEGGGVWLDLKNIKSMYERVKATANGAEDFPFPYNYVGSNPVPSPTMGWAPNPSGYPFEPAPGESATYIVFVHGWNQTYDRSVMYAETMFKRLWHRGYKGRFAAFRWPTFTGLSTYNDSEYRAWKCGASLKQYLDSIPSTYTVNLVAHSMGNIVSGSALEKGASVAKYALLNAAVPAICYDTTGNVVQTSWGYVTPNDDPDSATVALSYQGRLSSVSGNLINFFLPNDSALGAWELNNDSPTGGRYPLVGSKPHQWPEGSMDNAGYSYQRTAAAGQKLKVVRVDGQRILTAPDEAMAFAVQAPSLTAGADGRTRGSIHDWTDMTAYGFDSVHSAEFLFTVHQTRDFYGTLLLKLGVAVQP